MRELLLPSKKLIQGRWRLDQVTPAGVVQGSKFKSNDILYDWASIFCLLLSTGGVKYKAAAMYFEFENVDDPEDPVSAPEFDRDGNRSYYDSLEGSEDRDYLRVPLLAVNLTSTDEELFPQGNMLTFVGQTNGTQGVHGLPFSFNDNSKIFGAAIAVTPSWDDPTQDLLLNRFYADTEDQHPKPATGQVVATCELELG